MTNFIIGAIFGISALLLLLYIIVKNYDRNIKKQIGEDYEMSPIPKSQIDIKSNISICVRDDIYMGEHLDDDKNIVAFISCNPKNIENADFYYSLFSNKQIIKIIYENEHDRIYYAVITQIKLCDERTLRIYYTVLKNYVED